MPLGLSRHHDRRPADREVRFCPLGCLMRLDRAAPVCRTRGPRFAADMHAGEPCFIDFGRGPPMRGERRVCRCLQGSLSHTRFVFC